MPEKRPEDGARRRPLLSLCSDAELYELLRDEEFAGRAFEMLAVSLAGYALPTLIGWVTSGRIYRECANHGFPLNPTGPEREHLLVHGEEAEELVIEAVERGLALLYRRATTDEHRWNQHQEGAAALPAYFVGAAVRSFPTPWRRWSREFRRRPTPTPSDAPALSALTVPDPTDASSVEHDLRERLTQMPSEVRTIVELKMDGLTHAQIARCTGLADARAVDRRLADLRPSLRAWMQTWVDER